MGFMADWYPIVYQVFGSGGEERATALQNILIMGQGASMALAINLGAYI